MSLPSVFPSMEPQRDPSTRFQAQALRKRKLLLPVPCSLVLPSSHACRKSRPHGEASWHVLANAQLRCELTTSIDHRLCEWGHL